jgi:hypothetical protein
VKAQKQLIVISLGEGPTMLKEKSNMRKLPAMLRFFIIDMILISMPKFKRSQPQGGNYSQIGKYI